MKNIFLLSPSEFAGAIYFPTIEIIFFNKIIDFSDIDTILFTSKNAVDATNKINQEWKKIPVIAIGKKTAQVIPKQFHVVISEKQTVESCFELAKKI